MNELKESDEEENWADNDSKHPPIDDFLDGEENTGSGDGYSCGEDSLSLIASDDEYEAVKRRKEKDAKINNSYTGPYPLDPTDFNHTDKGANF